MSISASISACAQSVRETTPLVHCITNYVTVEGCANAVLAVGGSPIMSDEPADVEDITSICNALVLNIGTLNARSIEGMKVAGARAASLGHPIVLDPVGAGASALRTKTACELLDALPVTLVRGNMDAVTDMDAARRAAAFARDFAAKAGCVVAITGPIDIVADANRAFAVSNGTPLQGRITGSGCMLSAISGAYVARYADDALEAALSAVVHMGAAGQQAEGRMTEADGTGTFRTYLMDALSLLSGDDLARLAQVEEL